jgi:hypothetical protein
LTTSTGIVVVAARHLSILTGLFIKRITRLLLLLLTVGFLLNVHQIDETAAVVLLTPTASEGGGMLWRLTATAAA